MNTLPQDALFALEFVFSEKLKKAAKAHDAAEKLKLKNAVKIAKLAGPLCAGRTLTETELLHAENLTWAIASTTTDPLSPLSWNQLVLFVRSCPTSVS